MLLGDSWFLPTLLPSCPCLLAQSLGSIELSVPPGRSLQCPALLLQGFTVHTSIPPSPFPSLPLSLLLSDASRKRKFMEAVPRAVFPALVLVGACSWLAQPCLASAPSAHTKDGSCYPALAASRPQPPELLSASLDVPGTCSSLHLLCRIKFHFHIPTLGKM